jgi:hypothetical protein
MNKCNIPKSIREMRANEQKKGSQIEKGIDITKQRERAQADQRRTCEQIKANYRK